MNKTTHTPGPWHKCNGTFQNNKRGFHVMVGPPHCAKDIINVGAAGGPPEVVEEDEANARLIAAAPDIKRVLSNLYHTFSNNQLFWEAEKFDNETCVEFQRRMLAKAKSVIDEAEGR